MATNRKAVYYLPNGPKNLSSLFPRARWNDIAEYFIQVLDTDEEVVATSPVNKICGCAPDEKIRIHFLNYCGTYDAVDFLKPKISHEDTASEYKNGLSYPLHKTDTGTERYNVGSNDIYDLELMCTEAEMKWLQECFDSPKLYMEWRGTEGQPDDFIPVVKVAGRFEKQKVVDEWFYKFTMQVKLSNEFQTVRN